MIDLSLGNFTKIIPGWDMGLRLMMGLMSVSGVRGRGSGGVNTGQVYE